MHGEIPASQRSEEQAARNVSVRTNMRLLHREGSIQMRIEEFFPLDLTHVMAEWVCAGREVAVNSSAFPQVSRQAEPVESA